MTAERQGSSSFPSGGKAAVVQVGIYDVNGTRVPAGTTLVKGTTFWAAASIDAPPWKGPMYAIGGAFPRPGKS